MNGFCKYFKYSRRSVGNLYIGSNVKQRQQLGENYLGGTNIVAVKGTSNIELVSTILKHHGAKVKEFEYNSHCLEDIRRAIRNSDILIDGVQKGGDIEEAAASNPCLIVAHCDCEDPFSAMTAVARIAMAMVEKEKTKHGQRLIALDCMEYWKDINRIGRTK